ncbi:hypothetical protein L6452_05992 [Arctium lappa]|uniref:Uncharacterized protein n=1 Tax=Arctium lappa TaxID=4217 RepID=A0ACB9EI01_ARCLA|nr:hypothetical protein L6452_05992 [Arctium lappa]
MLDEIINYVKSLQQQVEMKLAIVNPELNIDIDHILSKDHGVIWILLPRVKDDGDKEKKEDEDEDNENILDEEEDSGEDYEQNVDFDNDEDDFNMSDDVDGDDLTKVLNALTLEH